MTSLTRTLKHLKRSSEFILTPRLDAWLTNNSDLKMLTDEDFALLKRLLMEKGRNRAGSFTGSQAGDCQRRQMFRFLGLPPLLRVDPVLSNIFIDGTWRHLRWQMMLRQILPGFQIEVPVQAPKWRFVGSLDGYHPEEKWGWEHKGTGVFGKVVLDGVMDPHKEQAVRYWLATDEDPHFPELDSWVFTYEDKRHNDWKEIVVRRDDPDMKRLFKIVRTELMDLNEYADRKILPPVLKECSNGRGATFRECPWSNVCLGQQWPEQGSQEEGSVTFSRRKKRKPGVTT